MLPLLPLPFAAICLGPAGACHQGASLADAMLVSLPVIALSCLPCPSRCAHANEQSILKGDEGSPVMLAMAGKSTNLAEGQDANED